MTNKSEQDGDSSKTIEIGDMKYHIFQVCGPQCCTLLKGCPLPPGAPPWLVRLGGSSRESVIIFASVPSAFCVLLNLSGQVGASRFFPGKGSRSIVTL